MNIKRVIITVCMILSFSFMVPSESFVINEVAITQTTSVAVAKAAKKKVVKKAKHKTKKAKKTKKSVNKEAQVYVTETGSCYHTHACGRGTFYKASLSAAKARGLRKCSKCY